MMRQIARGVISCADPQCETTAEVVVEAGMDEAGWFGQRWALPDGWDMRLVGRGTATYCPAHSGRASE